MASTRVQMPDHEALSRASALHGEGFWIVSPERVGNNVRAFRDAFARAGVQHVEIGWSVKTQWLPVILAAAFAEQAVAEVVSAHELDLVLRLGVDPATVIYNGVGKTRFDIERALLMGTRVHLDSESEVENALRTAADHPGRTFNVGLRANIDLGLPVRGRFGLDAESGQLQAAWKRLRLAGNLAVTGLHVHASGARGAGQFGLRARRLIALSDELWGKVDFPGYIDLGGGFCGEMPPELSAQMPIPPPSWDEYAEAIASPFRERWPHAGPRLVLEPGVALAADTTWFAARVLATKTIAGQRHAITSASVYTVKPMQHPMDMPFIHVPGNRAQRSMEGTMVVSGYTCMESDILHRRSTAALEEGDWLLFQNCGAYTNVMTPRFIRGVPAALLVTGNGLEPAMHAESVADWLQPMANFP